MKKKLSFICWGDFFFIEAVFLHLLKRLLKRVWIFAVEQFAVRKNVSFGQVKFFFYGELSYGEKSQSPFIGAPMNKGKVVLYLLGRLFLYLLGRLFLYLLGRLFLYLLGRLFFYLFGRLFLYLLGRLFLYLLGRLFSLFMGAPFSLFIGAPFPLFILSGWKICISTFKFLRQKAQLS